MGSNELDTTERLSLSPQRPQSSTDSMDAGRKHHSERPEPVVGHIQCYVTARTTVAHLWNGEKMPPCLPHNQLSPREWKTRDTAQLAALVRVLCALWTELWPPIPPAPSALATAQAKGHLHLKRLLPL